MRLLLDTPLWLWMTRRVARALDDDDNELWLSPISVWELLILVERRRLSLHTDVEEWVAMALKQAPVREAPLTYEVALETRRVRLPHQDPADRFLAATARVFDLTLVTSDARLLETKGLSVLPNR